MRGLRLACSRQLAWFAVVVGVTSAAGHAASRPSASASTRPRRLHGKALVNVDLRLLHDNRPDPARVREVLHRGGMPNRSARDEKGESVDIWYPSEGSAETRRTRWGSSQRGVYAINSRYSLGEGNPQWSSTTTIFRRGRVKYTNPTWQLDFHLTGPGAASFPYDSVRARTAFSLRGKQLRSFGPGKARAGDIREAHGEVWYDDRYPPRYSDSGTFWKFRLSLVRGDGATEEISDGFYMLGRDGRSIESVLSHVNWKLTDSISGNLRPR